ncbi:MAG: endonuclease III [Peptococcaceae bacterium]|nr:endonuclease III [Peptococcaceae bacterium]
MSDDNLLDKVNKITMSLALAYPDAGPALVFETPFELLVATVLSAQCTDKTVNRVTAKLFKKYRTAEGFAGLKPEELAEEIKECGLYKNKSKYLVETAKILLNSYGGTVPQDRSSLETLPGVGKKTAGVISGILFDSGALPVDTHVYRIAHRLGLSGAKNPHRVEEDLAKYIPAKQRMQVHHRLLAHGRQVCTARKPACSKCCLAFWCEGVLK